MPTRISTPRARSTSRSPPAQDSTTASAVRPASASCSAAAYEPPGSGEVRRLPPPPAPRPTVAPSRVTANARVLLAPASRPTTMSLTRAGYPCSDPRRKRLVVPSARHGRAQRRLRPRARSRISGYVPSRAPRLLDPGRPCRGPTKPFRRTTLSVADERDRRGGGDGDGDDEPAGRREHAEERDRDRLAIQRHDQRRVAEGQEQHERERAAEVRERQRVHQRADVIAADVQRGRVQRSPAEAAVDGGELERRRRLTDGHIGERPERRDDDPGEDELRHVDGEPRADRQEHRLLVAKTGDARERDAEPAQTGDDREADGRASQRRGALPVEAVYEVDGRGKDQSGPDERRDERIVPALDGRDDREQECGDAHTQTGDRREALEPRDPHQCDERSPGDGQERRQPDDVLDRVLARTVVGASLRDEHLVARLEQAVARDRDAAAPTDLDPVPAVERAVELDLHALAQLA